MSRHADPDPRPFWRSLTVAALRSLVGLAVVAGLFAALASVGQPFGRLPIALDGAPESGPARGDGPVVGPPAGTTVRVLDAAGDPSHAEDVAATLTRRGFDVVGVGGGDDDPVVGGGPDDPLAGGADDSVVGGEGADDGARLTTVLFAPGSAEAARSLAHGDERFSRVVRDAELPRAIDLYVVVGDDWRE